jgi:hypothetical protein
MVPPVCIHPNLERRSAIAARSRKPCGRYQNVTAVSYQTVRNGTGLDGMGYLNGISDETTFGNRIRNGAREDPVRASDVVGQDDVEAVHGVKSDGIREHYGKYGIVRVLSKPSRLDLTRIIRLPQMFADAALRTNCN